MTVGLVWARARNGVIGAEGRIPWTLPEDTAHFAALTRGSVVLMGRLTWESLPAGYRPLRGRRNLVLTRNRFDAEGATPVRSVADALALAPDLWVIGGERVYADALDVADVIVETVVLADYPGDRHAPVLTPDWVAVEGGDVRTSTDGLRYTITTYRR